MTGGEDLHPKALGLGNSPPGEVASAQPFRESGIVLDPRAVPCLPTGDLLLHHDGADPFRGGIHGGGEPRRATAHDEQLVERLVGLGIEADPLGDVPHGRPGQPSAVRQDDEGKRAPPAPRFAQVLAGLPVALDVEPAVAHP